MDPRLGLLAGYNGPFAGSFVPMLRALRDAATARGWRVEIAFTSEVEGFAWYRELREQGGALVLEAPDAGRRQLADWVRGEFGDGGPTVLHTHFTRFDLPALALARERARAAVIWHIHTPLARGPKAAARNLVKYGLLGRSVDAILAAGPDPAGGAIRAGARRDRVEVVGGGIEIGSFPLVDADRRAAARAALGIEPGEAVLLHLAWDWQLKDGDLFLATLRELLDAGPERPLLGVTVRGGEAARSGAERLGLGRRLRVLEGVEDMREVYAAADLLVASSQVEGQPFAVIEAILSGLPVVATDLPGHRDICAGLASCRLVERDPAAMASAALELLERPRDEAASDAEAAREAVAARFDLRPWAEAMVDRYERVLACRTQGRPEP